MSGSDRRAPRAQSYDIVDLGLLNDPRGPFLNAVGEAIIITNTGGFRESARIRTFLFRNGVLTDIGTLLGENSTTLPAGNVTLGRAINAAGQITGDGTAREGIHPFLYTNGVLTDLGTLGGRNGHAMAINASGQVTGAADFSPDFFDFLFRHAFLYGSGLMKDLGTLGGTESEGNAINAVGEVAGRAQTADGSFHAFLYSQDVMKDLGTLGGTESGARAINDAGEVTGNARTADGSFHAFLYSQGTMKDLGTLGGTESGGDDINAVGEVTGFALTADGSPHSFLYSHGVMTDLGAISPSQGNAINAAGQVTGSGVNSAGRPYAFIYSDGTLTDLNTLIPGGSGWSLDFGTDINDKGQITGHGIFAQQSHGFLLTPVFRVPRTKDDCKSGGWDNHVQANKPTGWQDLARADGSAFKNQGDCVSYVNTGK
jgi:probable HAF family extracellular repeat protein